MIINEGRGREGDMGTGEVQAGFGYTRICVWMLVCMPRVYVCACGL